MIRKISHLIIFLLFLYNISSAEDSKITGLEKRVEFLEHKVKELELKITSNASKLFLRELKRGVSKTKIKNNFGNPDRIGKYSNGDELWGFQNYTLRFDKNGKLQNWSKPFSN